MGLAASTDGSMYVSDVAVGVVYHLAVGTGRVSRVVGGGSGNAAVSGQPYAEYVQEHILGPLGLESTSPEIPEEHRGGRLATPYSRTDRDGKRGYVPEAGTIHLQGHDPTTDLSFKNIQIQEYK